MDTTSPTTTPFHRWTRAALVGLALAAAAATTTGCVPDGLTRASSQASELAQEAKDHARAIDQQLGTDVSETAADGQDGGDGLSAEEFCQLLRETQPELDAAGDPLMAQFALLGAVSDAYEQRGALAGLQGSTLDDLSASCPDDRDAAYEAADITTFTAI